MAISKVTDNNLLGLFVAKQMINNPIRRINWKAVSDPDNHSLNDAIRKLQQNEYAAIVNIPYDFTEQFIHYIQYGLKDEPTIGPTPTLEYFYDHSRDHTLNTLLMQSMQQIIHQLNAQIRQDFYANDDTVEIIKNASTVIWSQPIELKNKPMYIEEQFGQGFSIHLQVLLTYVACTIIVLTLYHASPKLDEQADNLNCPIILCDFISDTARGIDCQGPWFSRSNLYRYLKGITGLAIFCLLIWSAPLCFYESQLDGGYTSLSLLWLIYSGLAFIGLLSLLCLLVGIKLLPLASALLLLLLIPTSNILVDTALSPAFYRLGQGFPVFYAIRGLRFILFGSLQQLMWINCTVLLVWIIAPLLIHLIVMQWQHRQQRVQ
ncbi:hypothetical protein BDF19DRAFT_439797 [Syncephalis fuscata]|nr:hypothetical protein BDF19DRAFT_439797 [Syncephalis fuscata]